MSKVTILRWQEIPSVVEARDASGKHKVELSQRFQELIDRVAMRQGLAGTDAYLMEWNKIKHPEREEAPEAAAKAVAGEIEERFEDIKALVTPKS